MYGWKFSLWRCKSGAIKSDFRPYIRLYTYSNENFEYGYPHSNACLKFCLELELCKQHKATCNPTKSDEINDIKLFFDSTSQDYTELPYLEWLYSNQTHLTIILELATWTVLTFSNLNLVYKAPIRFMIKAR